MADAVAQLTVPIAAARTLNMTAVLKLHNHDALEQLIREQQDTSSPIYHHWLTPEEFNQRFGPPQAAIDRVTQWLAGHGFAVDAAAIGT
ncbi:MAG: protease pro-enzyme activation domain-containing protein, partial [Candidatus Binataceae bacterium]